MNVTGWRTLVGAGRWKIEQCLEGERVDRLQDMQPRGPAD
jgi:hypothetical protein